MPRGDGTGPMGTGPLTGRGAGICAGYAVPGYANRRDFGCGSGGQRGFRRMYYATGLTGWERYPNQNKNAANAFTADEKEVLKKQAEFLKCQLKDVEERLADFDGSSGK